MKYLVFFWLDSGYENNKCIFDIFYSPEGKKCRSKPQMMQYLPADFDMEKFEFRQGANAERMLRKRKSRKLGFDFGKDFKMVGNSSKPSRQTKKSRESLPISILRNPEGEKKRYHVRSRYFNPFFGPFFWIFFIFCGNF